jgi:hypothetical protein
VKFCCDATADPRPQHHPRREQTAHGLGVIRQAAQLDGSGARKTHKDTDQPLVTVAMNRLNT